MNREDRAENILSISTNIINILDKSCELRDKVKVIVATFSLASIIIKHSNKKTSKKLYKYIKDMYKSINEMSTNNERVIEMLYDALMYKDNGISVIERLILNIEKLNFMDFNDTDREFTTLSLRVLKDHF